MLQSVQLLPPRQPRLDGDECGRVQAQVWALGMCVPDVVITALLAEAGTNIGTLFLDYGTFVGDGLGCSHVADELLDYYGCDMCK